MSISKVKFALLGCGRIGQRHAQYMKQMGDLVAVCDVDPKKSDAMASSMQAKAYYSLDELLKNEKEVDLVSVCTPNGLHAEHSIQSLKAGVHVLCEKPMALSVHDCGEMIKTAESNNRRLFIVKQNRFNPPIIEVKKLIDQGKLGKLFSVQLSCFWNRNEEYYQDSWRGTKDLDGGTLFTQFSHFVDLLYWMIGDVKKAHAIIKNYNHAQSIEFEDTGVASLEFYNGVIGTLNYTVNSYDRNMEGSLTIFGEKGTVKIGGQYLNEMEYQSIEGHVIENLPSGNPANNYGKYQGSMSNHDKVYQNVVEVLTQQGVIATNGFEGLKTVEIIEKIYSSARHGQ